MREPFEPFDHDAFNKRFDKHFERTDKMLANPGKTMLKFGGLALIGYLIFWLVIIAAIIFGLSLVF